jgi:AraC family chitin signaling transcriptional activator
MFQCKNYLYSLALLWLCLLHSFSVLGQEYRIEIYRVEQGLPTNLTKAVFQDKIGFVWASTDAGLIRMDGKQIINFAEKLPSNYVKHIIRRKQGDLLVANDKGLSSIDNQIDTVVFRTVFRAEIEHSDSTITPPKFLLEDSKQRVWIGQDQAVSLWEDKKLTNFRFADKYHTTSWTRGFVIAEDGNGNIFAASQQGAVFRYDEQAKEFVNLNLPPICSIISACFAYKKNILLLATENGILEINLTKEGNFANWRMLLKMPNVSFIAKDSKEEFIIGTWNTGIYTSFLYQDQQKTKKISKLSFKVINDIFVDSSDNFWVSSDDGIAFLHSSFFISAQIPAERNYLISEQEGKDNSIYVTEGAIIAKVKTDSTFASSLILQGSTYYLKDILSVTQNQYGIWFGTSNAMVYRLQNNRLDSVVLGSNGAKIIYLLSDKHDNIWACQHETKEIIKISPTMKVTLYNAQKGIVSRVYSIKQDIKGNIYCGGNSKEVSLYKYDEINDKFLNISSPISSSQTNEFRIDDIAIDKNNQIWLSGTYGLFKYSQDSTRRVVLPKKLEVNALAAGNDGSLWLGTSEGLLKLHENEVLHFDEMNGLPSKTITHRGILLDNQQHLWIATAAGLAYSQGLYSEIAKTPMPVFLSLKANNQKIRVKASKNIVFPNNSYIETSFISLIFPSDKVVYQYRLVEKSKAANWSSPASKSELILPQLQKGNYVLEIRALQQGAFLWSDALRFKFSVEMAWYLRWWAWVLYIVCIAGFIYGIFSWYTKHLVAEKEVLENLVLLRTQQIQLQKDDLDKQNQLLELQNVNILASIHYAKRIQDAMLPTIKRMHELFPDSFVLFKPKDIVSGDFYWCTETKFALSRKLAKQIVAVVDCTGHGVPGAFMSLIANSLLDEICIVKGIEHTDFILKELNKSIQNSLKQQESENMDGLDIALCIIDKANNCLEFSGAKRPLFYANNGVLETIKGHFHCIGGYHVPVDTTYTRHKIEFKEEIVFYLTSDGYQDQFGANNKRLSSQQLRKMLLDNHKEKTSVQKELLENYFVDWQAGKPQNDDVLILGIRVGS